MDADWLDVGHRYADLHEEFEGLDITDVVDLNSLPVEIIVSFGWLRQDSACRLLRYCWDKFLIPLGFVEESSNDDDDDDNVTENDSPLIGQGQSINNELVLEWLGNVGAYEEIDEDRASVRTVEWGEVDGDSEDDGDMATSQEL